MNNNIRYDEIPHTADLAARIYGRDLEELFENAAFAMFDMMADLEGLSGDDVKKIEMEGVDAESLLIGWLNELLYFSFKGNILFHAFKVVTIENNKLKAEAAGQKLDKLAGRIKKEIKAATYHNVRIMEKGGKHEVTVVFDV